MTEKPNKLSLGRLFTIGLIFCAASIAWIVLGQILTKRNRDSIDSSKSSVTQLWGPEQSQKHIQVRASSSKNSPTYRLVEPASSLVNVKLDYEPKKKGLTWNNTYTADFIANYQINNPSSNENFYTLCFALPSLHSSYHDFSLKIDGIPVKDLSPSRGIIKHHLTLAAGETIDVAISYRSRGIDQWSYYLEDVEHIQNFQLNMETNFENIDFPMGASSPTLRNQDDALGKWQLTWNYADVIRPQHIAMQMPEIKDAGQVASRISFFAPLSLLFFFAILLIFSTIKGINLHPMNYIFLAAGFFSFHLLFAYLADLIPLHVAFLLATLTSLALIGSYVKAIAGKNLVKIALPAQFAYLVLFSYSFLFNGVTGLTIAIGSIVTLALIMRATAKIDWSEVFTKDLIIQMRPDKPITPKNADTLAT